ncbi:hypothetical protein V6N11_008310 [Hibiscus sabdariffa]|uniref:Uncharacterized protein n=1 Tax=Hibiscus sabdariffa TaxID=183260 RepID=A0ABR2Q0A1_9ROSI
MCFCFRCICKTSVNISGCALWQAPVHKLGDSQMTSILHPSMSYLFKEKLLFQVRLMTLSLIAPFGFQLRAMQLSELYVTDGIFCLVTKIGFPPEGSN